MKTDKQIKGVSGVLVVNRIVNNFWQSDWQKVDQENDDAIDGIIHIRKQGELTGEVIYAQVKSGDGYKVITANRPDHIGVNLGKKHIASHRPRWSVLKGAVILIFVDNDEKAYWTDLKSQDSYSKENESIILVPNKQRFGAHSKGHFKGIGNFFSSEQSLKTITLTKGEISFLKISQPIKYSAREYYKTWSSSDITERLNPGLGEIYVNRSGWRHISRQKRGYDKIIFSWQLLAAAKRIILEVDKAYQIKKEETLAPDDSEYTLKDYISLRAKIIFPNRHQSIVKVILRRKKIIDKVNNTVTQKTWFYSVYEPYSN